MRVDSLTLAALVAIMAWLSLTLARGPGELAALWVGNGILTGWLLSRRTAHWPRYLAIAFAAELPARMLVGDSPGYAFAIASCNLVEAFTVAALIRRRVPDVRRARDWMELGWIAGAATLVACALSGAAAAGIAHLLHGQSYGESFLGWYAAHVVGMVIVATTTVVAHREGLGVFLAPGRRWSLAGHMALLVVTAVAVFLSPYPILFLAYPVLLLAAVRHGLAGVALGVIALGLVGVTAGALGLGPLVRQGIDDDVRVALLQLYLAGGCAMTIPVCLAMAERNRMAARLVESERRYRMLADHSHDVIARMDASGRLKYISPSATEIFGWMPGAMPDSRWDVLHPDDRDAQRRVAAAVLATGVPRIGVYRVRHRDGHYVWIESVARCIPAEEDGGAPELMLAARDIDARMAAEQALAASRAELERLTRVDTLTGLANRRQFDERLALALKRLRRNRTPLALMYLDVDHFKQINDAHGHAAGDAVLKAFGERLCACVRETDLVARIGGDEFAVLVEDTTPADAERVAAKIVSSMAGPIDSGDTSIAVTTSVGVAIARAPLAGTAFMALADAALYEAKRAGRNRYHLSDAG